MTEYTPESLVAQFLAGSADVLPWVAAGVGGGVALMFFLIGIRSSLGFFRELISERKEQRFQDSVPAGFGYGVVDFDDVPYADGSVSDAVWSKMSDSERDAEMDRSSAAGTW